MELYSSKVSCLSDEEITELLKLNENKKKIEEAIESKDADIKSLLSQEAEYKKAAGAFAFQK